MELKKQIDPEFLQKKLREIGGDLAKKRPIHAQFIQIAPGMGINEPGLTRREYFAAMAMNALDINGQPPADAAEVCVSYADALCAELDKPYELDKPNEQNKT